MKLYDEVLEQIRSLLPAAPDRSAVFNSDLLAEPGDKNAILFRSETAYELGGGGKNSVCAVLFGAVDSERGEVILYGKDLPELTEDSPFAHLTLVQLRDESEENLNCEKLKDISFCLFRLCPKGYHIRVSPSSCREQVRVAESVLKGNRPLSFINVGCSLIELLKQNPDVKYVKTVFITKPEISYTELSLIALKAKKITDAVQSTLQMDELDCSQCKMKPVCDEVEGLRELHIKKEQEKKNNGT